MSADEFGRLPGDPFSLAAEWLPANDDPDRPLMTLATHGANGFLDARSVLLSEFDAGGFYFHTDSFSRKVLQIKENPAVALCVPLVEEAHQLVVQGLAEVAPPEEQARAYAARGAYLQQLAWQNTREFAALPQSERVAAWAEFAAEHPDGFSPPETWIGFLVRPLRMTFWFGSERTASRRAEYARESLSAPWTVTLLAG